jgi:hypothetical protein
MVTRRYECPIDDPRPPPVRIDGTGEEHGDAPGDVGDDAVCLRARDREQDGELAYGQVRAQTRARDLDAAFERERPWPARSTRDTESANHGRELSS